jgi:fatty acid desaturase
MGLITSFWMIVLGVVALLDRPLSHRFSPDGTLETRRDRAVAWSVAAFVVGGMSALWGVWGLVSSGVNSVLIQLAPLYWLFYLAAAAIQALLGTLIVISGVTKLRGKRAFRPLLVMILGIASLIVAAGLGVSSFLL